MEILTYFSILAVCFLGVFAGATISLMAKEELRDGKKYFALAKNLIFIFILFFIFLYHNLNIVLIILLSLVIFFVLLMLKVKGFLFYILLGFLFYLSSKNTALFTIVASLIFLYGVFAAAIFVESNIKQKTTKIIESLFLNYLWFVIIAATLYFIK